MNQIYSSHYASKCFVFWVEKVYIRDQAIKLVINLYMNAFMSVYVCEFVHKREKGREGETATTCICERKRKRKTNKV